MRRIRSELIALKNLHPWDIAETLLPEYTEQQYKDLEEFLENGGQLAPVVIAEDGRIIDGYNRWRTAKRLKLDQIECDIYSYEDASEMEMHAIVLNSKRRHLNKLQMARAAARLANLLTPVVTVEPEDEVTAPENTDELIVLAETAPETPSEAPEQVVEEEEKTGVEMTVIPPPPLLYADQSVRDVSQKLGISHSTVKQVSKVDKSGDEMLITAMEDKVITIRQAAEIAELDVEFRRRAIEAIDEEKRTRNNYVGLFSRTCNDCLKKLQTSRKKFRDAEFSESECNEMKTSILKVIGEAKSLMLMLSNETDSDTDADKDYE